MQMPTLGSRVVDCLGLVHCRNYFKIPYSGIQNYRTCRLFQRQKPNGTLLTIYAKIYCGYEKWSLTLAFEFQQPRSTTTTSLQFEFSILNSSQTKPGTSTDRSFISSTIYPMVLSICNISQLINNRLTSSQKPFHRISIMLISPIYAFLIQTQLFKIVSSLIWFKFKYLCSTIHTFVLLLILCSKLLIILHVQLRRVWQMTLMSTEHAQWTVSILFNFLSHLSPPLTYLLAYLPVHTLLKWINSQLISIRCIKSGF